MGVGATIKRTFQGLGCLMVIGVYLVLGTASYFGNNPEADKRFEVSAEDAKHRVDEDAPFWTKVGVLVTSWWHSDELVAETQAERALDERAEAKNQAEDESNRFNDSAGGSDNDYYPSQD